MVELSRLPARQAFVLEAAGVPSVSCVGRAVLHRPTSSLCSLKVGQSEARAAHVLGVRVSGRLCFCRRQSRRGWGGETFGQARGDWRLTLRGAASRPPPVFSSRFGMKMAGRGVRQPALGFAGMFTSLVSACLPQKRPRAGLARLRPWGVPVCEHGLPAAGLPGR